MIRLELDLDSPEDLKKVNAQWKFAQGLVPGEPNEGLTARIADSPARLADYDDSSWEVCETVQTTRSKGLTFGWYRTSLTLPQQVQGRDIAGWRVVFETCIDDYGEIWVDGQCDFATGTVAGFNKPHRVTLTTDAQPGQQYVIACLAANGPLAAPYGGIFMRYARLAFENYSV